MIQGFDIAHLYVDYYIFSQLSDTYNVKTFLRRKSLWKTEI